MKQILWNLQLEQYVMGIGIKDHPVLKALRKQNETMPEGHMQIAPLQGQFLRFLVSYLKPKKILEIGTYTGYSTLCMALGLGEKGHIIACDSNKEWTKIAKKAWKDARVDSRITLHLDDALTFLSSYPLGAFDFIFIDADKRNYEKYYERALELLAPNGLLLLDNMLWSGRLANPQINDELTSILRSLNKKIHKDVRVDFSLLPIGDGMTMIKKNAA